VENINIRLPDAQVRELDQQVSRLHYSSRSEFVREALRMMIENQMGLSDETVKAIGEARGQKSVSHAQLKKKLSL
jgi:Arc/MetJ-type ribon-helix-helix transcriptional regulator